MKVYPALGRVLPALFVVLGVLVMRAADQLPYRLFENVGGSPGAFPFLLGAVMCSAGVGQLAADSVKAIRDKNGKASVENQGYTPAARLVWTPWMVLGCSLVYTALLPTLGYVIASILWVGGLMVILRPKRWLVFGIGIAGFIVIGYIASYRYLPVRLPAGLLGR